MSWLKDSPPMSYYDPPEPEEPPACPICNSTLYDYIIVSSLTKEICGCTNCIERLEGWEYREELDDAED